MTDKRIIHLLTAQPGVGACGMPSWPARMTPYPIHVTCKRCLRVIESQREVPIGSL